ncbi:L-aspartate oxidase [Bacillus ectoiniformans]|uniref:L-aspartate oxidase n=1 Tax=Bacillus ectoiniformans TaxID=1494429 RepID=UPI0019571CBA|nr:L-aspartate oxidase [Bacillus ectoiniformans]
MTRQANVIIIGGGVAALQMARHLRLQYHVMILTKTSIRESNSYYAQGGIAAVIDKEDSFTAHANDTYSAGRYHHSVQEVQCLVEEGALAVKELLSEGFPADKSANGEISLGLEGAHGAKRIVHAGGDATGRHTVEHLLKSLPENVEIIEHEMAAEIILSSDRSACCGVKTIGKDGTCKNYFAQHIVMATGGAGALYPFTSNQQTLIGDGIAMAFRAGAEVADMEFMQFHPTLLFSQGETKGLVSEAVRGDGGVLVNEAGKRLMEGVHPLKDLAPRHITAYEIYKARARGEEVYIDIRKIRRFKEKYPTITALCRRNGLSIEEGLLPVAPGSHFLMGGIVVDTYGRTKVKGLYAIGETACTGVHGANRLASNSLLEGLVYGKRTAHFINHSPVVVPLEDQPLFKYEEQINGKTSSLLSKEVLQQSTMAAAGMIRTGSALKHHLQMLEALDMKDFMQKGIDDLSADEAERLFMQINSYLISRAAWLRTESRGAHIRSDYSEEDRNWSGKQIIQTIHATQIRRSFYEWNQARVHA